MNERERAAFCKDWAKDGNFERIAEVYEMTVAEAYRIIDEEAAKASTADQIRRDIFAERLQTIALKQVFFEKAIKGDTTAVDAVCKLAIRFASLLGLDAPKSTAHLVAVASAPALDQRNAQRMLELFDRLSFDPLYGGNPSYAEDTEESDPQQTIGIVGHS